MDIKTLKETILAAKLHPIVVDGSAIEELSGSNRFIGSLDEYLEALQAIAAPAAFIRTSKLEESMFFHEPEDQDEFSENESGVEDEEGAAESGEVDLRFIDNELKAFEVHIGSIATYRLSSSLGRDVLDFVIDEPWWVDFMQIYSRSVELVDDNVEVMRAKAMKEVKSKNLDSLNALRKLIDDFEFVLLPTQKAKIAYAKDQIPELEHLEEYELKREVQELDAKIKARGLNKRR